MAGGRTRTDSVGGRVWGRLAGMTPLSTGMPLAERYLLLEQLGAGGMSVVWRGFDDVLGRPVAVKVLSAPTAADPAFRAAIRTEARASARLSHPNITQVYDYGEATLPDGPTVSYVVMELLDGQTLGQRLIGGALPWREAVHIAAQVAQALAAAHRRGIVHRDIAPANVMLTATGAKVLDFGIAALAGGRGDPDGGGLLGTPAYVAPERLDDAPAAPAADVYALGALLYELLTGETPVPAKTWTALAEAYRSAPQIAPLRIPGLPPEVQRLCIRCLAPDPADRPGTAEVAQILLDALNEPAADPVPAPPPALAVTQFLPRIDERLADERLDEPPARTRRPAVLIGLAALLLLIATALVLATLDGTGSPERDTGTVATSPFPSAALPSAGSSSAPASPTGNPGSPAGKGGASASTAPSVTAVAPLPIVETMITDVQTCADAGSIRADVALDLENVLHQLRGEIMSEQPVDYATWSSQFRTKISLRVGEQGITESCANQLLSLVDQLSHSTA